MTIIDSNLTQHTPTVIPPPREEDFRRPHTLMVQGATSDAGKSILVTALCRILARHSISVAPFKPQNMALNSAVTAEGGEIGRAQAVQADACYLPASILMNPVLLKPNSDLGAQVIVNGKAIGNMQAKEYHHYKPELLTTVVDAHRQLQQAYSVVMVEGAGSPAEINLRAHDIANMGFAQAIDCPVIIVADIDRGGVFAHLYGTYALLSDTEKQRVKGFVINRFRGDVSLLDSGLQWLEEKTGVPTLAVIPYIPHLHIEAEDSLASSQYESGHTHYQQRCKIAVLMYPRASNHTDFDALRIHPHIDCEFVNDSTTFTGADMIILPGSKNVRGDLEWLKDNGWEAIITRHRRLGGKVIGICGGYQILGQWVHDPEAIESMAGSTSGLGLLSMTTTLTAHKTLRNVCGFFANNTIAGEEPVAVKGYEIHAGISEGPALTSPLLSLRYSEVNNGEVDNGEVNNSEVNNNACENSPFNDGAVNEDNTVMGSYIHGFFDQGDVINYCLKWAGIDPVISLDYVQFKEAEINRLADVVEQALPVEKILGLLTLHPQVPPLSDVVEAKKHVK